MDNDKGITKSQLREFLDRDERGEIHSSQFGAYLDNMRELHLFLGLTVPFAKTKEHIVSAAENIMRDRASRLVKKFPDYVIDAVVRSMYFSFFLGINDFARPLFKKKHLVDKSMSSVLEKQWFYCVIFTHRNTWLLESSHYVSDDVSLNKNKIIKNFRGQAKWILSEEIKGGFGDRGLFMRMKESLLEIPRAIKKYSDLLKYLEEKCKIPEKDIFRLRPATISEILYVLLLDLFLENKSQGARLYRTIESSSIGEKGSRAKLIINPVNNKESYLTLFDQDESESVSSIRRPRKRYVMPVLSF